MSSDDLALVAIGLALVSICLAGIAIAFALGARR